MNIFIPYAYFLIGLFLIVCALIGVMIPIVSSLSLDAYLFFKKKKVIKKDWAYINKSPKVNLRRI